jgi:DNA-binding NarL/FixJ family response regulator
MKKILVIEDEPQTRENLATILEMEGYQTITARDGAEGLAAAKRELPDLVLCDVMMPAMDGYAVLEALRAESTTVSIPFIFLTAKGDRRDLRTGMDLGADDYLSKPATAAELLGAIDTRLQRHKEKEEAAQQKVEFKPNFESTAPLERLGLTPREAEVLLWVAQGKSNGEIGTILGMSEKTVKIHVGHIFEKLGVDNRNAATLRAIEVLSGPTAKTSPPAK